MTCYLLVRTRNSQQEHYETAANDARIRARKLRKLGFRVSVSPLGSASHECWNRSDDALNDSRSG